MDTFFYSTYHKIKNNGRVALVLLILLVGVLGFLTFQIRFEEDITKLIPRSEENKDLQKVLETVKFTDKIVVNIRKQGGTTDELLDYASNFVDSVNAKTSKYVKNIQGNVSDDAVLETIDFVYGNLPLFLDAEDYTNISAKLNRDSIALITQNNYKQLTSPSGIISKEIILKDPLGISFDGLKKLQKLGIDDKFKLKNGFLITENKKNILLFITPIFGTGDAKQNEIFTNSLNKIEQNLTRKYKNTITNDYYGAAFIAVANAKQIKADIQFTVSIALTVLIIIFIFFYKRWTIPLILFVPTLFGGLLSVAFLYLLRGQISAISLGIGSVLLGVTLDYSLHIVTHIRNNANIKTLFAEVTKPIIMSSLTTALAFLCLLFIDSPALQDLGIFAAVSVLGASLSALIFIPQVYKNDAVVLRKKTLLDKIAAYDFHKNKILLGCLSVLLVVSVFSYNKVIFNKDINELNYEPENLLQAKNRLDSITDIASKSVYVASYGTDFQKVLEANESATEKLEKFKEQNKNISFNSISALVLSEKKQVQKIGNWKQFWSDGVSEKTENLLIESGNEVGFKPITFQKFYKLIKTDFNPISLEDYGTLPNFEVADFVNTKDGYTAVTTLVNADKQDAAKLKTLFKDSSNTLLIDRQQINESLLNNLKTHFNSLIWYCLGVVMLILLLFYQNWKLLIVTAVPIFLTWLLTIGLMGIFDFHFNIFNIIISTFIFGLGIDYSIFITNGMLTEFKSGAHSLTTHKTSIMLSMLTTILGVGVLIFAKHPALHSISVVCIIGIFSAVVVSFTIQPLLFKILIKENQN